jgi:hypothetical protein
MAVGTVMLIGVLAAWTMIVQHRAHESITRLAPSERAAALGRLRHDIVETCQLPEAAAGPLRERCLRDASLVLLFPECDAACGQAARALLPQPRR